MPTNATLTTRLLSTGSTRALQIEEAELAVDNGPLAGTVCPLSVESLLIGSGAECGLVLPDGAVSNRHAEITVTRKGYQLSDLDSRNGIVLGRWAVQQVLLADGMRFRIGETWLSVRALGSTRDVALAEPGSVGDLVARSVSMRAAAKTIEQLARSEVTVLLEGETGTGKELAAEAVHRLSARRDGPFVAVNSAGIPGDLMAAELFGYVKGAFSGAVQDRAGLFEEAAGGTLFLDEVGEIPLEMQPILLRAVERKACRSLGSTREKRVDVRIVAATNRNLAHEVAEGRFREDLFYRLSVGRVRLPPLRQRKEDIAVLAQTFAAEEGISVSPELLRMFEKYHWPGNVRELRNAVARLAAVQDPGLQEPTGAATPDSRPIKTLAEARRSAQHAFEADYLRRVLALTGGNVKEAAKLADVSRSFMTRIVARHKYRRGDRVDDA